MTKKKNSAMKKLIPATSMLLVSATMLTASTYAWFTMSRDVEVTGIKMKASVPEDLQISVGSVTSFLNANDSFLSGSATVNAPKKASDWSNTVNISQYYTIGKLIPASSDTGVNIFFTPDANGVGKTEKVNAKYYQAADGLVAKADTTLGSGSSGTSLMATLHPKTSASDTWSGTRASSYKWTNDDGYYVDIPVWLRSSSKEPVDLSVSGYVTTATGEHADDAEVELYKATRVAIIPNPDTSGAGTAGIMDLKDGSGTGWSSTRSIIDYYGTSGTHGVASGAVYKSGTAPGTITYSSSGAVIERPNANWTSIYQAFTPYTAGTSVVTLPGAANDEEYCAGKLVWIRVWLEGEDPQCWNQNEGQDWNISLKFEKVGY